MACPSTEQQNPHDRSWQEIAVELSHETDPDKLTDLATELNRVLDEEEEAKRHQRTAVLKEARLDYILRGIENRAGVIE